MNATIRKILDNYESDSPGTKAHLYRMLTTGRLGGTGRMVILPVDQGFEHGPAASFAVNTPAYDPHYHFQLAIDAGLNAYAAPLGPLEAGADTFAGRIPTILKVNSSNSLLPLNAPKDQAITGSVKDAVRLGCSAIGLTIYPGAPTSLNMMEEARELITEAKAAGIASVVWSYPRDGDLSKPGETAIDVSAYATHIAALLGAHIIKVKLPGNHFEDESKKKLYTETGTKTDTLADRVKHVVQAAFNGRRLVVFSGGGKKDAGSIYDEAKAIRAGGGNGSIIGRNSFQRPKDDAITLLNKVMDEYI